MISVDKALARALDHAQTTETELVPIKESLNRVLAEDILASRDIPPFDRVTMDGIAVNYLDIKNGTDKFTVLDIVPAGVSEEIPVSSGQCVQIMTGAKLPKSVDTVIPVEDIRLRGDTAIILTKDIKKSQFIHKKAIDHKKADSLIGKGQQITPRHISVLASEGYSKVKVKKLPKTVIISTGDELVDIEAQPNNFQIRQSNNYTIFATLLHYFNIKANLVHVPDSKEEISKTLSDCLSAYELVIISGGVSKGQFDYIPSVLESLKVEKVFHGVNQRPGKPLWFGVGPNKQTIFALPGNPVSSLVCTHKYVLPWLEKSLNVTNKPTLGAKLTEDVRFEPDLHYFLQVKLSAKDGELKATPIDHHGSGDFVNLVGADGFIELPIDKNVYKKGETYKVMSFGLQ